MFYKVFNRCMKFYESKCPQYILEVGIEWLAMIIVCILMGSAELAQSGIYYKPRCLENVLFKEDQKRPTWHKKSVHRPWSFESDHIVNTANLMEHLQK